jgi:hypothetical protein
LIPKGLIAKGIAGITPTFAAFLPFFEAATAPMLPASVARFFPMSRVIRPRLERIQTMIRPSGAAGFSGHSATTASSRLTDAVAAALAIGSLSLCLMVALAVLSLKVSMAMPIPA